MKTKFEALKERIQGMDIAEFIEFCGGDDSENHLCSLVEGAWIGCALGGKKGTPLSCAACLERYLSAPEEVMEPQCKEIITATRNTDGTWTVIETMLHPDGTETSSSDTACHISITHYATDAKDVKLFPYTINK